MVRHTAQRLSRCELSTDRTDPTDPSIRPIVGDTNSRSQIRAHSIREAVRSYKFSELSRLSRGQKMVVASAQPIFSEFVLKKERTVK